MTPTDEREIEKFLYNEARLLDSGKLDEWLGLYTDDAIYWVPANADDINPMTHVSIIYDDRDRMQDRVWSIQSGVRWSQDPPSRIRHLISNVEVEEEHGGDRIVYHLYVADEDMGKVIGKEGRIANAMRTVLKVAAVRQGARASLEIGR
jgi:3-phenylpropionate/cinnamic acid dioxygenase small subunit